MPTAGKARLKRLTQEQATGPPDPSTRSPHIKPEYSADEYSQLADKFEKLSWRMTSKPGGATERPDDFYRLYGLSMQVRPQRYWGLVGGAGVAGLGGGRADLTSGVL